MHKKMRKKCLVVLALCLWIGQLADAAPTMLTIHSKDGSTFSYCFADKPVITYNGDTLVLKTDKVNVEYPFSVLLKMTFTDTETSVETVTMSQSGEVSMVRIFNANGALVKTIEADETGADISFSTKDLPTGVYLIQEKSKSYKIIKK